ncbi:MAG: tRNA uridine-5-carboxymethylaminomethyl(34) synthesis GTPase MnmE [Pacificimonas sp.]|jgi:tRNA modification GTPase|nr:tRNA uridine-5-carboxymethylaminomethyl(34) synthesis GTPase MnmE [Pacificimonas sp.]
MGDVMAADTIFALASGAPPAAVAVLRISGPSADRALSALTGGRALPDPRRATLRPLVAANGDPLETALVLRFPGPASFTGEDVVELQVTGSAALVSRLQTELAAQPGLRIAEPGEFARRAVHAGKLGLTEAEGLAALIDAETDMQMTQALMAAGGTLRRAAEDWRTRLISLLADIEAELDFGEAEADISDRIAADGTARIEALAAEIAATLAQHNAARLVRRGITIAVIGPPNAGKSSLVNALSQSDAAIVSPQAGTTRDVLTVPLDIGGYRVDLLDTAGLHEASDPVEREGIRRALARAEAADLVLDLAEDAADDDRTLAVHAKADLSGSGQGLAVSSETGAGLDDLLAAIRQRLDRLAPSQGLVTTSERQRGHLEACQTALHNAADEGDTVLRAEHLRTALHALGALSGHVEAEAILDQVFARFCMGK